MDAVRKRRLKLIAGFIRENIGRDDALAALPSAALSAAFLAAWLCAVNDRELAERLRFLMYWPACEMVSVLIFQYMMWIFDPDPKERAATPVWQRVAAVAFVPLFLFGLKAAFVVFKKVLAYFWPFIAAKAITLWLRRPTEKDRTLGCLGAILGLGVLGALCVYGMSGTPGPTWYLFAGFPYFAALACFELIAGPLYALPPYESWK